MTTFIGAEYIIAYTLITKIQSGFDTATFQEVRDFGTKLQNELNKNNILNGFGLLCHTESLDHLIIPVIHPDSFEKKNKLFSDAIRLRRKLLDCCIKHNNKYTTS